MTQDTFIVLVGGSIGTLVIATLLKALVRLFGASSAGLVGLLMAAIGAAICGVLLGALAPAGTGLEERVAMGFAGATVLYKVIRGIVQGVERRRAVRAQPP